MINLDPLHLFHELICKSWICRSSHRRCSVKKDVLRNLAEFTRKHLCLSLFLKKVAGLNPGTLLKKRLWRRNIFFFKNTFSLEHLRTTASRYGVKALISYLYFFIFLIEDLAMSVIQLLLVIFSKRLDNLFSVYGGLDLQICIYRKYAFRFTAFSFLFIVLCDLFPSRVFFNTLSISFFWFSSFPFLLLLDQKCWKPQIFTCVFVRFYLHLLILFHKKYISSRKKSASF